MDQYLSLAEVKELLEREKKERGSLSPEQTYALQQCDAFARLNADEARKLVHQLLALEFVSPMAAYKITDLLPTHVDDVRAIFAKERIVPDKDGTEKILQIVSEYL